MIKKSQNKIFPFPLFEIKKSVYFVPGYKNACIINEKSKQLFHINKDSKELIIKLIENPFITLNKKENQFINNLIEKGLFSKKKILSKTNIKKIQPKISFAWIELTTSCNLNCIHCYIGSKQNKKMSLRNFDIIVNELKKNNIKRVQLIGGEPLLLKKEELRYIINKLSNFEFIEIFTNGTLIDKNWSDLFKNNNINLAISLHSNILKEHEKVTKIKGSFNKTINAIQLLDNNKIPFRIARVEMNGIHIDKNNNKYLSNSDIVRMSGNANIDLLNKDLIEKKLITKETFKRKTNVNLLTNFSYHNCFGKNIYIDVDLNVFPCVMEREFKHGNLLQTELKNLLNHEILTFTKDSIKVCKYCEFRYNCFDCRPDRINSDKFDKPWYCTYDPIKGIWKNKESLIKQILNSTKL